MHTISYAIVCIYNIIYDIGCNVVGLSGGKGVLILITSWIENLGGPGYGHGTGS